MGNYAGSVPGGKRFQMAQQTQTQAARAVPSELIDLR